MKNLFKNKVNINIFYPFIVLLVVFLLFPHVKIYAAEDNSPLTEENTGDVETFCNNYVLLWNDTKTPVDPNNGDDFTNVPAPITTSFIPQGDEKPTIAQSNFNDDLVSASSTHKGKGVYWECKDMSGTSKGLSSADEKEGMEECEAAIKIAGKWGAYTALNKGIGQLEDYIKDRVIREVFAAFQRGLESAVGNISLSKLFGNAFEGKTIDDIKKGFEDLKAGDIEGVINNLVPNTLKDEAKKKADEIKKKAEDELKKLAQKYGGKLVEQAEKILSLPGVPGAGTEVPVKDQSSIKELKQIQAKQDISIQEQKRQEIIAAKRTQCHLLLQQTVQSIKSALLYQFTTQTVDWIEGGGIKITKKGVTIVNPPQYAKQPLKTLKAAGMDAVDRWLSRVTPQLCQPFRLQVMMDIPSTARETNPYYEPYLSCTLNRVVQNIEGFYEDFRSGGWLAYREILRPQNNYYGASLIAKQLALQKAEEASAAEGKELDRNQGFKNVKKCIGWEKYKAIDVGIEDCHSDFINNVIRKWSTTKSKCYELETLVGESATTTIKTDKAKAEIYTGVPEGLNPEDYEDVDFTADEIFLDDNDETLYSCTQTIISQPGTVAKSSLEQAVQADVNAIINAQDLMNIDTVIQNAIINKLTKLGVNGLKSLLSKLPSWANIFE